MQDEKDLIQTYQLGKFTIEMLPEGYQNLNRELSTEYHPKLKEKLQGIGVDETDIKLSIIASYCKIVLDGTYTLQERDHLCSVLAGRLELLREYGH